MDLSFARIGRGIAVTAIPTELAVLLARVAARQAGSATARLHARLVRSRPQAGLLAPADGAFDAATASSLQGWDDR